MLTTDLNTGQVSSDIMPSKTGTTEAEACCKLPWPADIQVDVYIRPSEEAGIDSATTDDDKKGVRRPETTYSGHQQEDKDEEAPKCGKARVVVPKSRRDIVDGYRRRIIGSTVA